MNIIDFLDHDQLTPGSFDGPSWEPWRAVLGAAFGLALEGERAELFKALSGGRTAPESRVRELWVVAGRRSAKTQTAGALAVYLATVGVELGGLLDKLSKGERGVVALIACDRAQARVALGYIVGLLEASPVLSGMVRKIGPEVVELERVDIQVMTNSHRSVRGRTLLAAVLDEVAFFRSDTSASPDTEVYRALVPGLATTGGLLVGISSPYARRGLLYSKYSKHYGRDGDVLVVQGATRDFNPTIDPRVIEDAEADDPSAARAEWHGQFRDDVESFVSLDVVQSCTVAGRRELPPVSGVRYFAFVDPSGGRGDAMTMAVAHRENDAVVIDAMRAAKPPFSPEAVTREFAELLKRYRIASVVGDRYGGEWPSEQFRKHGITYKPAAKPKSELYGELLAALNSGTVELIDDPATNAEIVALERRTGRGGRDSIDHAPGAHDDRANAVAGAVHLAQQKTTNPRVRGFDDKVVTGFFARLARAQQGQDVSGWD